MARALGASPDDRELRYLASEAVRAGGISTCPVLLKHDLVAQLDSLQLASGTYLPYSVERAPLLS